MQETQLDDPFHVRIVFVDQSEMVFRAVLGSPEPRIIGEAGSIAFSMNAQASNYTYLAAGVMIRFSDGSSCTLNFGKKISASALASVNPPPQKLTFA
jgi:hypothetical protein